MKKALRVVLYLLILCMAIGAVSNLFEPRYEALPYDDTIRIEGFFAEPQDSLDVVFVGASTSFMGINPSMLWREYGIPSYAFCSCAQRVQLSQLYVKEAIARQHPKVICLDVGGARFAEEYGKTSYNYVTLNLFPFSLDKLYTIFNYTPQEEWASHLLPLIKFHSTAKINFKNWEPIQQDPYLGYSPYFQDFGKKADLLKNADITETEPLAKNAEKALREIIHVCEENDVQLVLYNVPMLLTNEERKRINEVKSIAKEENIPFLDMNCEEWLIANNHDIRYDNANSYTHANWRGATKITRTIGEYLIENGMTSDRREEPAYASWHERTEPYYRAESVFVSEGIMESPEDLESYLAALGEIRKDGVAIIVSAYDEASTQVTQEADELLMGLGAGTTLRDKFRSGYLLVNIDGETAYFGTDAQKALTYEIKLDGVTVKANSAGYQAISNKEKDDLNKIVINGKSYTTQRGLNIYVYDYVAKELISQARFDTYTTTERK